MMLNMTKRKRGKKEIFGRGEAKTAIFNYIYENPGVKKGKLEDEFSRNTVWYNIYRNNGELKDKVHIKKISAPKGKKIDSFYIKGEGEEGYKPNIDYLKFLMKEFVENEKKISDSKQNKKLICIINEMENICFNKKIRDEKFIDFLLTKASDEYYTNLDSMYRVWNCIQIVAQDLYHDITKKEEHDSIIEKRLIDKIKSLMVGYLEKIIFDKEIILEVRSDALDTIVGIDFEKSFGVAFKLLNRLDTKKQLAYAPWDDRQMTEFTAFRAMIGYILVIYAKENESNWVECRKQLLHLLDFNGDKLIKNEILTYLELTSLKSEIKPITEGKKKPATVSKLKPVTIIPRKIDEKAGI